jgi:glycosyltransferase involved in cell wall biosynthesis
MKISIVTTAYKTKDYILDYLLSIDRQIKPDIAYDIEVILGIDNCKETAKEVKKIQNQYNFKWLRVYWSLKNVGTYILRNTLVKYATTNHLVFFDSDDIMRSYMIKTIYEHIIKYKAKYIQYRAIPFKNLEDLKTNKIKQTTPIDGSFYIEKTEFLKIRGFKDWRCGADTDFHIRYRKFIKKYAHIIDIPLFLYRKSNPNSITQGEQYGYNSLYRSRIIIETYNIKNNVYANYRTTEIKEIIFNSN